MRPRLIISPLRPPCNIIYHHNQTGRSRSLPHDEGPNLGKSLLVSRPILPARTYSPSKSTRGILLWDCRGRTTSIGAVCGKNACWIAVSAAPSYLSAKIHRENLHQQKWRRSLHSRSNPRQIAGDAIKLHHQPATSSDGRDVPCKKPSRKLRSLNG